ncbi:MAG: fumarylacetoacetate hydrolase family protein [Chromatocurvus sp.]
MKTVSFDNRPVQPSKIICIGMNYTRHIEELGNQVPDNLVVFLKPNSAIGNELNSSLQDEPLHYEGEISLMVMGGRLAGVGFGLDLTRRELQSRLKSRGLPWERAKAFDGAALFSSFAPLTVPIDSLEVQLCIDGEERQRGDVSMMLYSPATILEDLSAFMSLEDGDIVMTGTPAGVGPVTPGADFHGRVLSGGVVQAEGRWRALM